jgi:hypothetical protein
MDNEEKVIQTITETYVNCEPDEEIIGRELNIKKDDIIYFLEKAIKCVEQNDTEGVTLCLKRINLMHDALIIYRLHHGI